jgi:YD repeat-containing protein
MGFASVCRFTFARCAALLVGITLLAGLAHAGNVTYTVDPASGRVTKATYPDGTYITYGYDEDGNRTSAVVTLAADTTPPTQPGTLSFTSITATSATVTWGQSSDNRAVTSYEWSRNGGSTWTNVGNVLTTSITGLSGSTSYTVLVRARDAAGNTSPTRSGSFTTSDITPPTQPGVLSFTNITATSATASWAASTDNVAVTSYEWSRNGGSTWTNVGNVLTANLTGLTGSTSYTVLVRAKDAANNLSTNRSGTFSTADVTPPSQPGAPTFSSITATSATATWTGSTDNVAVTAYEWSRNGGSSWTSVGTALSASITGLTGSTNYTVLVRARDAANNVSTSSSGSFTTAAASDTTAPGAPGVPTISAITATTATATWTAATDNIGVASYEWSTNGGGSWNNVGNVLSVGLTGLTNGTSYTFQVRAKDAANNVGASSSRAFTTLDNAAPSAPGTPSFSSITATSATASWTAATDNVGVSGYEYSLNGGSWTAASSGVSLSGLANGTTYSFQVRAFDAAGNRGNASSNSFTTLDTSAPSAPGTPTFSSVTGSSAVASWSAATDNVGVSGYEYSLNGGSWTAASSGVTLSGLTNGTTYSLQVRAFDAAGNRGSASSNSFTTVDTAAPTAPGTPGFSSITGSSATASWAAASDNVGVVEYQYSLSGGGWTSTGSATSVGLTGLTNGTSYSLQVRARDAANNWSAASSNSFTTLDTAAPTAPGTPSFSSITGSSATASWGAASDNVGVTSYEWSINGGSSYNNVGSALSASITGLSGSTTYTVLVRARDAAGNVGSASSNSFTTSDVTPPGSPGTPSFSSVGSTTAVASWSAASDNVGVARYEYSVNGGGWTNVGNTTSATISGLTAAASNTVAIRAVDAAGNAGNPSSGSVTTIAQVTISNRSSSVSVGSGGGAAVYILKSTGDLWGTSSSTSVVDFGDWLVPKSGMGQFEVYATLVSSTACSGGPMNTWTSLGGDVTYSAGRGGPISGVTTCTFNLQIRHSSNPSVILATAQIALTASK